MSAQQFSCIKYFQDKSILITGTTGFVGKVLLEKVLRVLQPQRVYLLIRTKKGQETYERFSKEIISSKCFDRLREIRSKDFEDFIKKVVVPLDGDLLKPGLGLSQEARQDVINNVNVIINSAASVDFNSSLKVALEINYYGCQRMLDLAKECKQLENFIHVSTAYVNSDQFGYLEEKIYNPDKDVEGFVAKLYKQSHVMTEAQQKIALAKFPNTYTYTKNLAEQMLSQQRPPNMQITIIRPTIVGCSMRDPNPGWIDSLVGGAAVLFFAGIGLVKVYKGNGSLITDQVPVDFVVDQILVAAAYEANQKSLQIYHSGTSARNPVTWEFMKDICLEYWNQNVPQVKVSPCTIEINNNLCYYRMKNIQRKIPALLYQQVVELVGLRNHKKQADRYLKVIDKADIINKTFKHFNRNEWIYSQENSLLLMRTLDKSEQNIFLLDVSTIDWRQYFLNFNYGLQKYILKENVDLPVEQEQVDLLRSWKSSNFGDIQWILNKNEFKSQPNRLYKSKNLNFEKIFQYKDKQKIDNCIILF
ncbi:hypothetical protein pb186bvf_009956 [Paramecium bursaria]